MIARELRKVNPLIETVNANKMRWQFHRVIKRWTGNLTAAVLEIKEYSVVHFVGTLLFSDISQVHHSKSE